MIVLLIFGYLIQLSYQSECLVSQWGTWSECFGGCQRGLIVRNRDVVKPPLPELNAEGKFMQRLCPHLYETRFCDRNECELQNVRYQLKQADLTRNMVEKQMDKIGMASDNINLKSELKKKFISETEQLFKLDNFLNGNNENISNNVSMSPSIDVSSKRITNQEYRLERISLSTSNKPISRTTTIPSTTTTTTSTTTSSPITTASLAIEPHIVASSAFRGPRRFKPTSSEFSISNLIKKIEQSLDSNQPLDETFIKNSMKRNRKLAKILVDAYRHRFAAKQYELQSTLQSTTTNEPMQYWPKTGYIPNSRKHASDITSQLYMTHEIVQTMEDDPIPIDVNPDCEQNRRCCPITRHNCTGGEEPRLVKRWYRPKGSSQCVSYDYPRCSMNEEMEELPILFQQNCQDLCFGKQEKRISPLFNLELDEI